MAFGSKGAARASEAPAATPPSSERADSLPPKKYWYSRSVVFQVVSILIAGGLLVFAVPLWAKVLKPATEADAAICPYHVITNTTFLSGLLPPIKDCKSDETKRFDVSGSVLISSCRLWMIVILSSIGRQREVVRYKMPKRILC